MSRKYLNFAGNIKYANVIQINMYQLYGNRTILTLVSTWIKRQTDTNRQIFIKKLCCKILKRRKILHLDKYLFINDKFFKNL